MILRKDEYARRRRQLMKMMGKGGIAILPAAPERQRNSDVHYHYRPDSDFHYLTGFGEPEAVAVLIPGRPQAEYILFVRDRDPLHTPMVLVAGHGPFTWGDTAQAAVYHAAVLEELATMAFVTRLVAPGAPVLPERIVRKHFERKHGKDAYYGQPQAASSPPRGKAPKR